MRVCLCVVSLVSYVFPPNNRATLDTEYISHRVSSSHHQPIFFLPNSHVCSARGYHKFLIQYVREYLWRHLSMSMYFLLSLPKARHDYQMNIYTPFSYCTHESYICTLVTWKNPFLNCIEICYRTAKS